MPLSLHQPASHATALNATCSIRHISSGHATCLHYLPRVSFIAYVAADKIISEDEFVAFWTMRMGDTVDRARRFFSKFDQDGNKQMPLDDIKNGIAPTFDYNSKERLSAWTCNGSGKKMISYIMKWKYQVYGCQVNMIANEGVD